MEFPELELLAPAGKWDVLEQVIEAGADAVYLGGKGFNMRMLRPDFNFSESEIKAAAVLLHEKNKKLYITVNNLYNDQKIGQIKEYLQGLENMGVDGFIVQDMGIVQIYRELGLTTPLHASVQMGIASLPAAQYLEDLGFTRAIFSKNLSLEEIAAIHQETHLEIEFFVHGDLCISHTGQCHLSSFVSGQSANRGCCVKPCRWQYALAADSEYQYLLASNDLCLYPCLAALIDAGVVSFKIEGRMRDKEYLRHLVKTYRRALDRIIHDPDDPGIDQDEMLELENKKIRNFTTGNLWGKPNPSYVDPTGTREPMFISRAFDLKLLSASDRPSLASTDDFMYKNKIKELTVKVHNVTSAAEAVKNGADKVIIGLEKFRQTDDRRDRVQEVIDWGRGENLHVWLETPRIVTQKDVEALNLAAFKYLSQDIAGVIVNDYGSFQSFKAQGCKVSGGAGLNITNQAAVVLAVRQGLTGVTASPELDPDSLASMLKTDDLLEVIVQGPLCGLITDHCLIETDGSHCGIKCSEHAYHLLDKKGQAYAVRTDQACRNYIYHPFDLCLYNDLPALSQIGLRYIRIDGQFYDPALLGKVIAIYRRAIDRINKAEPLGTDDYQALIELFPSGLTKVPSYFEN